MAAALVTINFKYPDCELRHSTTVQFKSITFMELMPRVVDLADDILKNDLPPNCRVTNISIDWDATP